VPLLQKPALNYRKPHAYNDIVLASLTSRFPPFLLPLILINLTGHMALSGGRVSGSLYVLALSGQKWLGAITPIGGTLFIAGWALIAIAGWRNAA